MKRVITLLPFIVLLLMTAAPGWAATPSASALSQEVLIPCAGPTKIVVPESDPDGSYVVRWGASPTAGVTYVLQEARDAAFNTGLRVAYRGLDLRASITGRQAGKKYYYRVKASKPGMAVSPWNNGANGCAVRIQCAIPVGITVPASASRGNFTVSWGASTTAGVTYVLEEAVDSAFTSGRRVVYSGPAFSAALSRRPAGKSYYYRVQAIRSGKAPSSWRKGANGCAVLFPCAPPDNLMVPASDTDGNYLLTWGSSPTPGVSYVVQEAKDPAFTTDLRTIYQGDLLTTSITDRGIGIYYYRVKATKVGSAASAWERGGQGCVVAGDGQWYLDLIVNLDSREPNERFEDRLFGNWHGTNDSLPWPTAPLDRRRYDYQTTSTVYDTLGASHEVTVYFDRTTEDNLWEFLVTCDPSEDRRALTSEEQVIYAPDTRYNHSHHKGAGALLYGTMQFDTSGNLAQIDAFNVPPDGQVDPAKSDNRLSVSAGAFYFSFPSNFTGAESDQRITINFGAHYEGRTSTQSQVLVSDRGARVLGPGGDASTYIDRTTTWANVADENGKTISQGDMFIFDGYNNGSDPVTRLVYTVDPAKDVQDLLSQLEWTFGCSAAIDAQGRLRLYDHIAGDSSMFVTRFETVSANSSTPFGGAYRSVTNGYSITPQGITIDGFTPVTDDAQNLVGLRGENSGAIAAGDVIEFSGMNVDGVSVGHLAFTVGGNTDFITPEAITTDGTTAVTDPTVTLVGLRGTDSTTIIPGDTFVLTGTDVNGAAVNTTVNVGAGSRIQGLLNSIASAYDGAGVEFTLTWAPILTSDGSSPVTDPTQLLVGLRGTDATAIAAGDIFTFSGTDVVGAPATTSFTVLAGSTLQDLLDAISMDFGAPVTLDSGRIRIMDSTNPGLLTVNADFDDTSDAASGANPFGLIDETAPVALTQVASEADGVYAILDHNGKIQVIDPHQTWQLAVQITYNTAGATTANPFGLHDGTLTSLASSSAAGGDTIRQLLDFLDTHFGGTEAGVHSVLDQDGKIRVVDTTQSTLLTVNAAYYKAGSTIANPFGLTDANHTLLTQRQSEEGQINITTSKKMVLSAGRAFSTDTGDTTPITATTPWSSVFDDNRDPWRNGGLPRAVANGDQLQFVGTKRDGSSVISTFTVDYTKADGTPSTVQDLLDQLEDDFDCQAAIDSAGRLVLTDWIADSVGTNSNLAINAVVYPANVNGHDIFGVSGTGFDFIPADVWFEDGSQQGDVVTTNFAPGPFSTTQYANSSTTYFWNYYGQ